MASLTADDRIAAIRRTVRNRLCTDAELAVALSVSTRTVHRLVAKGLPVVKIGRNRLFDPTTAAEWMTQHCATARAT